MRNIVISNVLEGFCYVHVLCYVLCVVQYEKCMYFLCFSTVFESVRGSLGCLESAVVQNCCYFIGFRRVLLCAMYYVLCARCCAI